MIIFGQSFSRKYPSSRDDSYFARSFLRALSTELKKRGFGTKKMREEVAVEARIVFGSSQQLISDKNSHTHIFMCSFVLAAHLWLEKQGLEKHATHSVIEEAFSKYAQFWTKLGTRLGLFFAKNKLSMIANEAERKSKSYYGGSFQIISEGDRENLYSSNVLRCGYFEFFKTHGRPEITKALCK